MIEVKQNGLCVSCRERITHNHVVVSSGRPRHYYHKYCAIKHHIISAVNLSINDCYGPTEH